MRKTNFIHFAILLTTLFSLSVDSGFGGPLKKRREKKARKIEAKEVIVEAQKKLKIGDKGFSRREREAIEEAETFLGSFKRKKKTVPSIISDVKQYNKYIGVREKFKKEAEKKRKEEEQYLKAKDMPGLSDDTTWTEKRMEGIAEELKPLREGAKWFDKSSSEIKREPFKETEEGKRVLLRGRALDKELGDSIEKEMLVSGRLSKMFSEKKPSEAKDADLFEGAEYKNLISAHKASSAELKKMVGDKYVGLFEYDESAKRWVEGLTAEEARKELEDVDGFDEKKVEGIKKLLKKQLKKRETRDLEIKKIKKSDKIARELKLLNAKPVKTFNDWEDVRNLRKRFSEKLGDEELETGIFKEPPSIKDLGKAPLLREEIEKDVEGVRVTSKKLKKEMKKRDKLEKRLKKLDGRVLADLENEKLKLQRDKIRKQFDVADSIVKRLEEESASAVKDAAKKVVDIAEETRASKAKGARELIRDSGAESQMMKYAKVGAEVQELEKQVNKLVKSREIYEKTVERLEEDKANLPEDATNSSIADRKKDLEGSEAKEEKALHEYNASIEDMNMARKNAEDILKEHKASNKEINNVFENVFPIKEKAKKRRVASFVAGHKKMLAAGTLGAGLAGLAGVGFAGTVGAGAAVGTGLAAGTAFAAGAAGEGEAAAAEETVYEPEPYTFADYDFASYEYGAEEFTGEY